MAADAPSSHRQTTPVNTTAATLRTDRAFDAVLRQVEGVEGWMTDDQAAQLWSLAREVPNGGKIVEIGSYRGRSAIVLASAAAPGVEVFAIDPHAGNDRGPQQIKGLPEEGDEDHESFVRNLTAAGVADRVRHVRLPSQEAFPEVSDPIDVLYIDGAHRLTPARADIVGWGARVRDGGAMAIHDSFSSIGVTIALVTTLFFGKEYRFEGRKTSLALYRKEPLRGMQRLRNAGRQIAQLPWWVRNVLVKLAMTAKLRGVVRRLGHHDEAFPY